MKDFCIKSKTDYKDFVDHLKSLSKNESIEDKKRHIAIINTKQEVIAIAMANIRSVAKKLFRTGYDEFLKIGLSQNYMSEFYEETLIQGLVIAEIKDPDKQMKLFEQWVQKIDNWGACDSVVSTMKSLKKNKDKGKCFEFYFDMCFSNQEFVARFGIVNMMVNFLDPEYIDQILKMCETVSNDAYYVKMAIAWLLQCAFVKFRKQTFALLKRKVLGKFVQNKAISKCRDSYQVSQADKAMLAGLRIK